MKRYYNWANKKIKKLNVWDIKLIKLSTAAFILMVAKLLPQLLILDWYWYGLIFLLAAILPTRKVFGK